MHVHIEYNVTSHPTNDENKKQRPSETKKNGGSPHLAPEMGHALVAHQHGACLARHPNTGASRRYPAD